LNHTVNSTKTGYEVTMDNIMDFIKTKDEKLTLEAKIITLFIIEQNGFKDFDFVEPVLAKLFDTDIKSINNALENLEKQGIKLKRIWKNS